MRAKAIVILFRASSDRFRQIFGSKQGTRTVVQLDLRF